MLAPAAAWPSAGNFVLIAAVDVSIALRCEPISESIEARCPPLSSAYPVMAAGGVSVACGSGVLAANRVKTFHKETQRKIKGVLLFVSVSLCEYFPTFRCSATASW